MESLDTAAISMDDLFDFSSDVGEDEVDGLNNKRPRTSLPSLTRNGSDSASLNILNPPDTTSPPFPDFAEAEEELEWLSNKDAFPGVDTFVDVLCNPIPKHQSPVSVLENSNNSSSSTSTDSGSGTVTNCSGGGGGGLSVPVRARSKIRRTRRRDFHSERSCSWWGIEEKVKKPVLAKVSVSIGRKCQHCGAEKTPQWRAGPLGPKTLCNACGVRYKSGRLVPEYMPASSPAFSSELHSNSHRKVMEMRKQKQMKMMRVGTCWG